MRMKSSARGRGSGSKGAKVSVKVVEAVVMPCKGGVYSSISDQH